MRASTASLPKSYAITYMASSTLGIMGIAAASLRLVSPVPLQVFLLPAALGIAASIAILHHIGIKLSLSLRDLLPTIILILASIQYVSLWMSSPIPPNLDFQIRTDPIRHIKWTKDIISAKPISEYPYPPVVHVMMALLHALRVPLIFTLRLATLIFTTLYVASMYSAYTLLFKEKIGAITASLTSALILATPVIHFHQDTIANLLADTITLNILPIALAFITDGGKQSLMLAAPLIAALPATHVTYIITYTTLAIYAATAALHQKKPEYVKRTVILLSFTLLSLHISYPWIIQTTLHSKEFITGSAYLIPPPRNSIELSIYEHSKTLYVFLRLYGPIPLTLAAIAVTTAILHASRSPKLKLLLTWWIILATIAITAKVLPYSSTQGGYNITLFSEKSFVSAKGRAVLCSMTPSSLLTGWLISKLYTTVKQENQRKANLLLTVVLITLLVTGNYPPTPHQLPIEHLKKAVSTYKEEKNLYKWIQNNTKPSEKLLRIVTLNYTITTTPHTKTIFQVEPFISFTEALTTTEEKPPNITYIATIETPEEVITEAIKEGYTYIIINKRAYNTKDYIDSSQLTIIAQTKEHIILKIKQ